LDAYSESSNKTFRIRGISTDTKLYNIGSEKIKILEDYDYSYKTGDPIPVLINRFVADKFSLSKDKEVSIKILNYLDRLSRNEDKTSLKFKVVGVINTFQGEDIITTRSIANKVISKSEDGSPSDE
jgi:hypothetical protein